MSTKDGYVLNADGVWVVLVCCLGRTTAACLLRRGGSGRLTFNGAVSSVRCILSARGRGSVRGRRLHWSFTCFDLRLRCWYLRSTAPSSNTAVVIRLVHTVEGCYRYDTNNGLGMGICGRVAPRVVSERTVALGAVVG